MSRHRALLLGGLLTLAVPALAQEAGPTLLVPEANSYVASGGYKLRVTGSGSSLAADIFAPVAVTEGGAAFVQAKLDYGSNRETHWGKFSLGRVTRAMLDERHVVGVNAFVDLGKKGAYDTVMGQASLGAEYERIGPGRHPDSLRFGANFYQPFRDYTDPARGVGGNVPRRGIDAFVAWSRAMGDKLRYGARASLFYYPATATRRSRGIGTLSLDGTTKLGLPRGTTLTGRVTTRYTPGEPLAPRLGVELRHAFQKTARAKPVGDLRPSRYCRVEAGEERLNQLVCRGTTKRRAATREDILDTGDKAKGAFTVPPPDRHLGYGSLYIP